MKKRTLVTAMLMAMAAGLAGPAFAEDPPAIYGSQLMTEQERNEYRKRIRNAANAEEREQIRKEHHERMRILAREKGITLPDEPPARGYRGMGPGGKGMGPGGGMDKGKR